MTAMRYRLRTLLIATALFVVFALGQRSIEEKLIDPWLWILSSWGEALDSLLEMPQMFRYLLIVMLIVFAATASTIAARACYRAQIYASKGFIK